MRKLLLVTGAAAMAAATPALAKPEGKGGGGKGSAHQSHGGGNGKERGARGRVESGKPQHANVGKPERARDAGPIRQIRGEDRGGKRWVKQERTALKNEARRRGEWTRDRFEQRADVLPRNGHRNRDLGFVGGMTCPPGLAKKRNGCLPPGQAGRSYRVGEHIQPAGFSSYSIPAAYRDFYADNDDHFYRYNDDGNIYRVDSGSNLISALIPLLGGGFSVGQTLPDGYDVYNVPFQYRDDFYDSDEANYRYGDDAIYRVDPQSNLIESVVALLTGDLNVGETLPSGYDAYNVPMEYRDEYSDTDESLYRYADGNIYEVDAKTQLIEAIVEMIA